MESLGRQAGEREFFVRTPEFEPHKGLLELALVVSLQNWLLQDPFPPTFGKRTEATINRT